MKNSLVTLSSSDLEEETFLRRYPENMRSCDKDYFDNILSYTCPPLKVHMFDDIHILPDGTVFKGLFPKEESFLFFKNRIKLHNPKGIASIRLKWNKEKLRCKNVPLIIHDAWTQNYYHWTTQALPRLLLAQRTGLPFTLLLPQNHQSDFHVESLRLFGITSWHTIEERKFYHAPNLMYPTHDIQIGDYNDELISLLRDTIKLNSSVTNRKKIFIRRADRRKRKIINEEDVLKIFSQFGFEIVEFEKLTFLQQRNLLIETRVLAGVHGAGLTNMIYMPNNSTTFEFISQLNGENYYFYSLSNALSHRYFYQVCPPDRPASTQEANFVVDILELRKNINLLLS